MSALKTIRVALPFKQLRAVAIKRYMQAAGYTGAVCFSCGNASRWLKETGVDTVDISPAGDLRPARWFTSADIVRVWPQRFNATSGYLPMDLMLEIGKVYQARFGALQPDCEYYVECGSGETVVCLALAYGAGVFVARYDNSRLATRHEAGNPLNALVNMLAKRVEILNPELDV